MEEEIWAFDTNILYHLNLQTEEMTWYRLRDKAMHSYIDITALYTDGEELYCVSSRANGVMLQQDKM